MRRLWVAGAAMLVCLVLGTIPAAAQKASDSPTISPVVVSGTWGCTKTDPGTRGTSDGLMWGGTGARDQVLACDLALDDPRVVGPTTITSAVLWPAYVFPRIAFSSARPGFRSFRSVEPFFSSMPTNWVASGCVSRIVFPARV